MPRYKGSKNKRPAKVQRSFRLPPETALLLDYLASLNDHGATAWVESGLLTQATQLHPDIIAGIFDYAKKRAGQSKEKHEAMGALAKAAVNRVNDYAHALMAMKNEYEKQKMEAAAKDAESTASSSQSATDPRTPSTELKVLKGGGNRTHDET